MRKILSCFLLVCILAVLPLTAMAQELESDRLGSISVTLVSQESGKPMAGAEFSVYHVATVRADTKGTLLYTYTDTFASCDRALGDPDLVKALEAFVSGKDLAAEKIVTDAQGKGVCEDLPLGLYFIRQTGAAEGFAPCASFLVTVPFQAEGGLKYDVDATPKTDIVRLVSITIKKVWNTDETAVIPGSVTVQLQRHGEVVKTATLNEANRWQVICADLPESDGYSVKEVNVPRGYTATYAQKGYEFTVTNTASLAQTGQLIWPIPVLAVAGIFFLLMGFALLCKPEKNYE